MSRKISKLKDLVIKSVHNTHSTPPDGVFATTTLRIIRTRPRVKALFKELGVYDLLWWKHGRGVGIRKPVVTILDPITGQPRLLTLRDRDLLALAVLTRWDKQAEVELAALDAAKQAKRWREPRRVSRPRYYASKGPKRATLDGILKEEG